MGAFHRSVLTFGRAARACEVCARNIICYTFNRAITAAAVAADALPPGRPNITLRSQTMVFLCYIFIIFPPFHSFGTETGRHLVPHG